MGTLSSFWTGCCFRLINHEVCIRTLLSVLALTCQAENELYKRERSWLLLERDASYAYSSDWEGSWWRHYSTAESNGFWFYGSSGPTFYPYAASFAGSMDKEKRDIEKRYQHWYWGSWSSTWRNEDHNYESSYYSYVSSSSYSCYIWRAYFGKK